MKKTNKASFSKANVNQPTPQKAISSQPQAITPAAVESQPPTAKRPVSALVSFDLAEPAARNVFVAGTFNGWRPESTPLTKTPSGHWVANVDLSPGRHEYLFVVDGQWLPDPKANESVQNPFGGTNSVISVAA